MAETLPTIQEVVSEMLREALDGDPTEILPTRRATAPQEWFTANAVSNDGTPVHVRVVISITQTDITEAEET